MNIAIVGLGRTALEQHIPAIFATPGIDLVAIASPNRGLDGVPWYPTLEHLLASEPGVDSIALCSPSSVLLKQATLALDAGRHVLLTRPSNATLTGLGSLIETAQRTRLTLMAAWPARFGAAVQTARELIATHGINGMRIRWNGRVDASSLNRSCIWDPGGLGTFNWGINAFSLLARLVPERLAVTEATLWFPSNRAVPVAANVTLAGRSGLVVKAQFDERRGTEPGKVSPPGLHIETDAGTLLLDGNGNTLWRNGQPVALQPSLPYRGLYQHFSHLTETGSCDLDVGPLMQVADAHLVAHRHVTDAFFDKGD